MDRRRLDSRFLPLVLDVVKDGIFTVSRDRIITSFNQAAERITGYLEEEVLGRRCAEVFQTSLCHAECPLDQSIASRDRIFGREVTIRTKDGRSIPIAISTAPLETRTGTLLGGVEVFSDLTPLTGLRRELEGRSRFDDIISKSPEMQRIFDLLPLAAASPSTILITGSSGTGKELVAKAIHNHSPRRRKRFVAVNCAALPDTLLESELFGYKKGAFTDARTDHPGRIALAEGGTLFIDEVADVPKPLQVKLLRFLQERVYEPLGSTQSTQANVRVIAATNQALEPLVHGGQFREDLYYRLNVLQIYLPSLAQRIEDLPLLVRHFVDRFRITTGKPIMGLSDEAMALLFGYPFPGNVRELENLIERAFILCQGTLIGKADLPAQVLALSSRATVNPTAARSIDRLEAEAIRGALKEHGGNRTHAARQLGIHRSTLIRKIRHYGLQ